MHIIQLAASSMHVACTIVFVLGHLTFIAYMIYIQAGQGQVLADELWFCA